MVRKDLDHLQVPDGAPAWVDRELIALTIETFEPYYGPLTEEAALKIIRSTAGLMDVWRWS